MTLFFSKVLTKKPVFEKSIITLHKVHFVLDFQHRLNNGDKISVVRCAVKFLEMFSSELGKDGSYVGGFVLRVVGITELE